MNLEDPFGEEDLAFAEYVFRHAYFIFVSRIERTNGVREYLAWTIDADNENDGERSLGVT